MRLNIELTPEELKKWDEKTMRFTDREMSANILLNTIDKNFDDFRHRHSTKLGYYNVRTIRNLLLGIDSQSNPFKKLKLRNRSPQRGRLDIHQVKAIYDLDLSEFRAQQTYKDIFPFSVFAGLAYTDASKLKQSNLNRMADGNIKLLLKRAKTDVITEMVLPNRLSKSLQNIKIQHTGQIGVSFIFQLGFVCPSEPTHAGSISILFVAAFSRCIQNPKQPGILFSYFQLMIAMSLFV